MCPVELPGGEKIGERGLLDGGGAGPGDDVLLRDVADVAPRQDDPAQAHRRRERLAGGGAERDVIGVHALQGGDGLAVIPVLRVVVVLQDQRVTAASPVEQGRATFGAHHHSGRKVMCGRDRNCVDVEPVELLHDQPACVHRYRDRLQSSVFGRSRLPAPSRILDPHALGAALTEREPNVCQRMC
jgi:hypothetical protein